MRKLIGFALTAAITLAPAGAAWADRDDRGDRNSRRSNRRSSCTLDVGVLTRTVSAQAFCGGDRGRETSRRGRNERGRERREDSRRSRRSSCAVDLGVLTGRTVSVQALCGAD